MQHVTKAATTTATDLGEFTAIAAAYSVDRQGERIAPGAFADTIQRWATSGKTVPLHWNHKAEPDNIIGSINTMKETSEGLLVAGQLDIEESETAREVCGAVSSAAVSPSRSASSSRPHTTRTTYMSSMRSTCSRSPSSRHPRTKTCASSPRRRWMVSSSTPSRSGSTT